MIRFSLHCQHDHGFDVWFSSGDDFDAQSARGLLVCPHCGSQSISKTIMAPAVATGGKRPESESLSMMAEPMSEGPAGMVEQLKSLVRAVKAGSENVGERFGEEARKIHYGESEARPIIGQASPTEVHALAQEGIPILPLPRLPEDAN